MGLRSQRPRRRWLFVALIVALIAGVTAATLALRSSAPPPGRTTRVRDAQALVKAIDANALGQRSVHWTDAGSVDDYSAQEKWRSTSDVTTNSGVQHITISRFRSPMAEHLGPTGRAGLPPKGDAARVEIRLVGDALYVKGNVAGLEWMALNLSHAQAMRYAGRWISLPKWRDPLGRVAEDLTLAQMVDLLDPARDLGSDFLAWREPSAPDGTQVLSFDDFDETMDGYTLTTLTGSKPLPVALDGSGLNDGDCRGGESCPYAFSHHFSRWNEPVHVIAPKHAVPIATVRKSTLALRSSGPGQYPAPSAHPNAVLRSIVASAFAQKSVRWAEAGSDTLYPAKSSKPVRRSGGRRRM